MPMEKAKRKVYSVGATGLHLPNGGFRVYMDLCQSKVKDFYKQS